MSDVSGDSVSQAEAGRWLSVQEATRQLTVSERTIYRRVDRGQLQRRTLSDGRVEVWVPDDAERRAPDSRHDVSPGTVSQERAVLLVDRVSAAVTRQLEALTIELAASRERIEALARKNGTLTERSAGLERELASVRQASDADRQRLQAELDQAQARIADLERPLEPAPDRFPQPNPPSPNDSPSASWWRRWLPWLASTGLVLVVVGSSCQQTGSVKHAGLYSTARATMDFMGEAAGPRPVGNNPTFWASVTSAVDGAERVC